MKFQQNQYPLQISIFVQQLTANYEIEPQLRYKLVKTFHVHRFSITSCELNMNGNIFITGNSNGMTKIGDAITGKIIVQLKENNVGVYCFAFNHPFYDRIVTGSLDNPPKIQSVATRHSMIIDYQSLILSLTFDPNSKFIATGSYDATARLWDIETGKQVALYHGHKSEVVSLHFTSCGDKLLTGSYDNTARIWDVKSGRCIHILQGHYQEISCVQFDCFGDQCATGSYDKTCKIWNVKTGQCIHTFIGHKRYITRISFNSTGTRLVTVSADGTGRVNNVQTGKFLSQLLGHKGLIEKVQYQRSKNGIFTKGLDGTVIIHSEFGECLQAFGGLENDKISKYSLCYSEQIFITASINGMCKMWKAQQKL